jgi:hypothetical protein
MAIDTEDKRRSVVGILPIPDGETLTEADRKQVIWIYNGLPFIRPFQLTLKERSFDLTLTLGRVFNLTLPPRSFQLTLENRAEKPMSKRVIDQSPVEIGADETAPWTLTIPSSWGTASNPVVTVKNANGTSLSGISSSVSVSNNVISFTLDGTALTVNQNFRVEIKFDVTGGTLEAYGIWQVRE